MARGFQWRATGFGGGPIGFVLGGWRFFRGGGGLDRFFVGRFLVGGLGVGLGVSCVLSALRWWLEYRFGGWVVEPGLVWGWLPGGFGGGRLWRGSTGVFVHSRAGVLGVVPIHPLDARGKTPLNLVNGVFPVNGGMVNGRVQPA